VQTESVDGTSRNEGGRVGKTDAASSTMWDIYRNTEHVASVVGLVMKMGPLCYQDEKKFPTGPWCKEGDFIFIPPFSGVRLIHQNGMELRLINDDTVQAVVEDPRGWRRA